MGDQICDGVGLSQTYRTSITVTRTSRPNPVTTAATRKRFSALRTLGSTGSCAAASVDVALPGVRDDVMPGPPSVPADRVRVVQQGTGCTPRARRRLRRMQAGSPRRDARDVPPA